MHFTVYLTAKLHIGDLTVILRPFITVYIVAKRLSSMLYYDRVV